MGEQLYPVAAKAVVRKPAAESLTEVQEELGDQGLGTKVFRGLQREDRTRLRRTCPKAPHATATSCAR